MENVREISSKSILETYSKGEGVKARVIAESIREAKKSFTIKVNAGIEVSDAFALTSRTHNLDTTQTEAFYNWVLKNI